MERTCDMCTSVDDHRQSSGVNEVAPPYGSDVYNTGAVLDSLLVPLYIEWEAE